jgi:hypothetical protein
MRDTLSSILGLGLLAGLVGFAIYFFGFGQTFEGEVNISDTVDEPGAVGMVTFQSRFRNRRFLTHSVFLDLYADTPTTLHGETITAQEAVNLFNESKVDAQLGYREDKGGWGRVVSLDLEPPSSSPKEILLIASLLLIFGCTAGMAFIAKG